MPQRAPLLDAIGGESACRRLSENFYARVARNPVLRPLFPGKTQKCAIEEFTAFLIQFLGGDEQQTQRRWWLSLKESHARFKIGPEERRAWLNQMAAALNASPLDNAARSALLQFFETSSAYLIDAENPALTDAELTSRWDEQRALDDLIGALASSRDPDALAAAPRFAHRPSVFVGILARMVRSGRPSFLPFVLDALDRNPSLAAHRFAGRTLLHDAAAAGCIPVVESLLRLGTDPNVLDAGGHTPLYSVANECVSETATQVITTLTQAGADVNASGGVTRATPLHMAARRGFVETARTLLDCGANLHAPDNKGCTPLLRARNCRRQALVQFLLSRGA